jgi:hypothetical protein
MASGGKIQDNYVNASCVVTTVQIPNYFPSDLSLVADLDLRSTSFKLSFLPACYIQQYLFVVSHMFKKAFACNRAA